MSQALELLDNALEMAQKEKTALEEGAYEDAIELARERSRLSSMAWNVMEAKDMPDYRSRLLELSNLQNQLAQFAINTRDKIRQSLQRSRQEKRRIKGYHLAVEQALQ